mgnify:CR=1 FL=1
MANVVHSGLTAANLHEPKGVASATIDKVYVSNGAGSGAWQKIESDQIDTTSLFSLNQHAFSAFIQDASSGTASLNRVYLAFPFACTVTNVYSTVMAAIAATDNVLTVANHAGSAMGTITVAFTGAAVGDVDTITAITTNNTFAAGERISVISDSGSATACPMMITFIVTRTA